MENLRIVTANIESSTSIVVKFTAPLTANLVTANVAILAESINTPDAKVTEIKVNGAELNITCLPLTSLGRYYIQFQSTPSKPFISVNGQAKLLEDGISNKYYFIGPSDSNNPVKSFFKNYFKENLYNIDDETTTVGTYIRSITKDLLQALYDIRQVKNENYLSFNVVDEIKTRGEGPFDRLNEESAYEVVRVARTPTGTRVSKSFNFSETPFYPISLQKESNIDQIKADSIDEVGKFNINNLTITLSKNPVIKVSKIVFTINSANPVYTYNIETLGYQILDSKYDQQYASTYNLLSNNQIKLSDQILSDPSFDILNILNIEVHYEYKNLGIILDELSLSVSTVYKSIRETLPPIINIFNLKYAPIVNTSGDTFTTGGITFTDPNNVPGSTHPAFKYEIPFRLEALPSIPGQYSIDYSSGTVYVFGESFTNDGTGPTPPLATYNYKFDFKENQDYAYDNSTYDLVALPLGNLLNNSCKITFNYEQVFIPEIDYRAVVHKESLSERIDNRLAALNVIKVKNTPINNVFKVFNETSGETYVVDRWNEDKIFIRYNIPPKIVNQPSEKISFNIINNELLFVESTLTNGLAIKIFKILLKNNRITSATEDSLGSSINSSLSFSRPQIFAQEKWFNRSVDLNINLDALVNVGEYCVDYYNGIIYCAVSYTQNNSIGTASYRNSQILLQNPHIISPNDIYYQIDPLSIKNKNISFISFEDKFVLPDTLEYSDEAALNNVDSSIYQIINKEVGSFVGTSFVPGVTSQIKSVRGIFELEDLTNSTNPLNFANYSTFNNFNISVESLSKSVFTSVIFDGYDYYILLDENIPYLSSNIDYQFSIIRSSDSANLWDSSGIIEPGNPVKLILSGVNSPVAGDSVMVSFNFTINNVSAVIIDYNKGDFFIDYSYLADEIIVNYQYGDNSLDFRLSTALSFNEGYYVTYKVGALRDALLQNFGNLINIPELNTFNLDFNRERYRDALIAGMTSLIQGPTLTAIKNIGKKISHIEPDIVESAFENWSLGSSLLAPSNITTTGTFELLPAKFYNGVLINSPDQTITFPASSNIRLEEGTFETWIIPQWNGLDNNAELTFNIIHNGLTIDPKLIFIGSLEQHPELQNGKFVVSKKLFGVGTPSFNKDGVFIYCDLDSTKSFYRWHVRLIGSIGAAYKINILSNGQIYDSTSINIPKPSNLNTFTGNNSITLNFTSATPFDEGISFISDIDHYILDCGQDKNINRLSIFKDPNGYLNFRIYDKHKNVYSISANISNWQAGDIHHIAASWKLSSKESRDEMHLFIDGLEVPNIIKYGQKSLNYLYQKFKTISKEEILGLSDRDIVSANDLSIVKDGYSVSSSINFSAYNIQIGDTIYIDEIGFNISGYTILDINGQTLLLDQPMPFTLTNGRFSVNRTEFFVNSDIDVASNFIVNRLPIYLIGYNLSGNTGSFTLTSPSTNFVDEEVAPGDLIKIDDSIVNGTYYIVSVNSNSITIENSLPINIVNATFRIYKNNEIEIPGIRANSPSYSVKKDNYYNNLLVISNNIYANDLIVIKTLGLNHRTVSNRYYVWSDNTENIIMTQLPAPISLDETKVHRVILPSTAIGPNNAVLSGGIYYSNNLTAATTSNSENGRTISVTISGNNVDFSTPLEVIINGLSGISIINETITFTDYGTLDFSNLYLSVNYIKVNAKPINTSKNAVTVECKEKYPITQPEFAAFAPVIKYAYLINNGTELYSNDGYFVQDDSKLFNGSEIGNYLIISSPISVAGYYLITNVSQDRKSLAVMPGYMSPALPLPIFNGATYKIVKVTDYRSGFQNGFFAFENNYLPSQEYYLSKGFYDIKYETYTKIFLDSFDVPAFLGSNFYGNMQANAIFDQTKIYSVMLTDTRVGESIPNNQRSVTKDYNSLKPLTKDPQTLLLLDFDSYPFLNKSDVYVSIGESNKTNKHFQSSIVVNENFGNSLILLDKPLILNNEGILNPKKQGTIEFWINPIFDTGNDPHDRYYFDAFGAVIEETTSVNNTAIKLSSSASHILSVKLKAGDPSIDYFAGGSIELDTQNAIQEQVTSIANTSAIVSKNILQVLKVEIIGDITQTDYFADGVVGSDNKTIYFGKALPSINMPLLITYKSTENKNVKLNTQIIRLNKKLPYQNSQVIVSYIPKGLTGDRLSIYKDKSGYMKFSIIASGTNYVVQAPIKWSKNTWHRVKASYKVNGGQGNDEMRLFLDGYEYSGISFYVDSNNSTNFILNNYTDGYNLIPNIKFKDPINSLYIGSQYDGQSPIYSLIDNLRISDISRPIYEPYGYPIDINYSSNLNAVYPVTSDLYTTFLLNFETNTDINTDFAIIRNRNNGSFDFSVNILDSFGIVNSSPQVQAALEKLIKILKPANSKVFIKYTR